MASTFAILLCLLLLWMQPPAGASGGGNCEGYAAPENGTRSFQKVDCKYEGGSTAGTRVATASKECKDAWVYNCKAGYANTGTTRTYCPNNRHNSNREPKCELCAAGKSSGTGYSKCVDCLPGHFSSSPGSSSFSSPSGISTCEPCPPHTYQPAHNATTCLHCAASAEASTTGTFGASVCTANCERGQCCSEGMQIGDDIYTTVENVTSTERVVNESNSTDNKTEISTSGPRCVLCPHDHYGDGAGTCLKCPGGFLFDSPPGSVGVESCTLYQGENWFLIFMFFLCLLCGCLFIIVVGLLYAGLLCHDCLMRSLRPVARVNVGEGAELPVGDRVDEHDC